MSSYIIDKFEKENTCVCFRWDKGETFNVNVGCFINGVQCGALLFDKTYPTKEQAKKAFKRQVLKLKKY